MKSIWLWAIASISSRAYGLHGRFLHITDMHPDPHYIAGSTVEGSCHSSKPKGGRRAGFWGTPASECDSPLSLINITFDFLDQHVKDQVDFVIWTGDNARHDIDSSVPRTRVEIAELNTMIAKRMRHTFGHLPIVTSIGNNDVYPHNILFPGPSQIISKFQEVWDDFIPEHEFHTFARGGYYSIEALPDLVLISLNSLYMFDNNKAVDGCPLPGKSGTGLQPGSEQLQWLEQQLILARMRGRQVIITGHVPPVENSWYADCYEQYRELVLRFHDTVLGQMFGHANFDYFTFLHSAQKRPKLEGPSPLTFADNLYDQYKQLDKRRDTHLGDFAAVNINPSVIPTFQPTLRIWQYNVSEGDGWRQQPDDLNIVTGDGEDALDRTNWLSSWLPSFPKQISFGRSDDDVDVTKWKKKHKKKKKKKKPAPLPRHFDPQSPSIRNSRLSLLGYTQFFLPLQEHEKDVASGKKPHDARPDWTIEYTTFKADRLAESLLSNGTSDAQEPAIPPSLWPKAIGDKAIHLTIPNKSKKDMAEMIERLGLTPYEMSDLTLQKWLAMARNLVNHKRAWKTYRKMMFVQTIES